MTDRLSEEAKKYLQKNYPVYFSVLSFILLLILLFLGVSTWVGIAISIILLILQGVVYKYYWYVFFKKFPAVGGNNEV